MSYWTMGKNYDWELEKYRMAAKSSDLGNRRWFFKNLAWFIKNPYGYTYWKSYRLTWGANFMNMLFGLTILGSFYSGI